ncbi:MAG: hypothetical protein ACC707_00180 [Thiohalomonadales bacterium]
MQKRRLLRTLFSPLLKIFESGTEPFVHKSSNRTILIVVGCLFCGLAAFGLWLALGADPGYLLPVFIFGGAGIVCLLVGLLGTDRAVAKLWGSKS